MLLVAFLAPIIIILFLRLAFPILSDVILNNTGIDISEYYSLLSITVIMVIPMLFGMVYAFILLDETDSHILQVIEVSPAGKKNFILMRAVMPLLMSLVMLLVSIVIVDAVPSEGWLRVIYVSILLSFQAPFVFLFIGTMADNKIEGFALSKLFGVFIIAVPLGLLLHHPWNYMAFYSPLYWIAWAWVIPDQLESLIYGMISFILTAVCIFFFLRRFLKKHAS